MPYDRISWPRSVAVAVPALLAGLLCGRSAAAAPAPTGPAARPPAEPAAPPVLDPGGLGTDRCAAAATTVVTDVPWAQRRLAPQRVWPITRGEGQTVAVVDSGVDGRVPQLAGRVLPGRDVVAGGGRADEDCLGHGTFVAGIIAAQPRPGVGFAGVAPGVRILPVRQTDGGTTGTADGMAAAIRWAADAGARIINVSAASEFTSPALAAAVRYAALRDALIVAAASNGAERGNPRAYPAAYPGVVGVAAIGPDGARSDFSEVGGYISVAAPGSAVLSVGPRGPGHLVGNGTSFAAPYVAGVAALVRAAHPALSAAQVKHRLEATADHPAARLPDPQLGWGVVNPYAAVTLVIPEELGVAPPALNAVTVPGPRWPQRADPRRGVGWAVAGAVLAAGACASLVWVVVPNGRRRRWRPAGTTAVPAPPVPPVPLDAVTVAWRAVAR